MLARRGTEQKRLHRKEARDFPPPPSPPPTLLSCSTLFEFGMETAWGCPGAPLSMVHLLRRSGGTALRLRWLDCDTGCR